MHHAVVAFEAKGTVIAMLLQPTVAPAGDYTRTEPVMFHPATSAST